MCVCIYLYFSPSGGVFFSWSREHARGNKVFNWLRKRCACVTSNNAKLNWVRASVAACTHLLTHGAAAVNEREKKRGSGCICEWKGEWANEAVLHLFAGRRARILIATAWTLSALFSAPIMLLFKEQLVQGERLHYTCCGQNALYVSI